MKTLWAAIFVVFFSAATADAAVNCSVGPIGNRIGDTIHGQVNLHLRDGPGFSWNVNEQSSGRAVTWDPGAQTCSVNCTQSFTWSYIADSPNETFRASQSPITSDSCSLQINSIEQHQQGTPIPDYVKAGAQRSKDDVDSWGGWMAYGGLVCLGWGIPGVCEVILPIAGAGLVYHSNNMAKLITDPPTDCYAQNGLNFPSVDSLGLPQNIPDFIGDGVVPAYTWGILYWITQLDGYGNYAYDEANSASACQAIGDSGMFSWHQGNLRWAVAQYAQIAANMAVHYRIIGDEFALYFNPSLDDPPTIGLRDVMYGAAQALDMAQQLPW